MDKEILDSVEDAVAKAGFKTRSFGQWPDGPGRVDVYQGEQQFATISINKTQLVISTPILDGLVTKTRADRDAKVLAWLSKTIALLNNQQEQS